MRILQERKSLAEARTAFVWGMFEVCHAMENKASSADYALHNAHQPDRLDWFLNNADKAKFANLCCSRH